MRLVVAVVIRCLAPGGDAGSVEGIVLQYEFKDGLNRYLATVTDPIVYSRPWTIQIPLSQNREELLEVACHEDNGDLQNLKNVRDEHRAQQKKGK